jgi:hypothetical protein
VPTAKLGTDLPSDVMSDTDTAQFSELERRENIITLK